MEKIYRILLGIFLVCLIPILLVLSYWSCRYSYYGTVDYSIRNLLIKDSTWKHIFIFLLASVIVYEGDKWLTAQNQIKQEKNLHLYIVGNQCYCVSAEKYLRSQQSLLSGRRSDQRHGICSILPGWQLHYVVLRRLCGDVPTTKRTGDIIRDAVCPVWKFQLYSGKNPACNMVGTGDSGRIRFPETEYRQSHI